MKDTAGLLLKQILVTVAAVLAIIAIELLGLLTDFPFDLSIVYIIPILWATWIVGYRTGIALAIFGTFACIFATLTFKAVHASMTEIFIYESMTLAVIIGGIVLLQSYQNRLAASTSDYLTGVANSRRFFDTLEYEVRRAKRYAQPLTLVFLDLDEFKYINDTHGHMVGDDLLRAVAGSLIKETRETDLVARLGGDEFMILMPEVDAESARVTMDRLKVSLDELMANMADRVVTFSAGVCTFSEPLETAREMVAAADVLMYEAKDAGKNTIKYSQPRVQNYN